MPVKTSKVFAEGRCAQDSECYTLCYLCFRGRQLQRWGGKGSWQLWGMMFLPWFASGTDAAECMQPSWCQHGINTYQIEVWLQGAYHVHKWGGRKVRDGKPLLSAGYKRRGKEG